MTSGFGAILHRGNYINRWGLMRNSRAESLSQHAFCTAYIAHILAAIANARYGAGADAGRVVCCALYHDAAEVMTGDLPTPVKYSNDRMRDEYKKVERQAEQRLIGMIPPELAAAVTPAITGQELTGRERQIVKAADKLAALVKCLEEEAAGNTEFRSARDATLAILAQDPNPETADYIREFIPAYSMTLDEIMALEK